MKTRCNKCVQIWFFIMVLLAWVLPAFTQGPGSAASQSAKAPVQSPDQGHAAIAGEWQGAVGRQRLTMKIEQSPDSQLKGTLTLVDQGNTSVPMNAVSLDPNGTLRLDLQGIGATYEGKLSADGSEINGILQHGTASVPLVFHRPGVAAKFTLKPRVQGQIALEPCRTSD